MGNYIPIKKYLRMYKLIYTRESKKIIDKLSLIKKQQIKKALEYLSENPESGKVLTQELKGFYSYRTGIYRIIYKISHAELIIFVISIGHRKDIYKKAKRKKKK